MKKLCNEGERQHTVHIGSTPSSGKTTFWQRMEREIEHVKKYYPDANYIGIADGSKDNWSFLEQYTQKQTLDFYRLSEKSKLSDLSGFRNLTGL